MRVRTGAIAAAAAFLLAVATIPTVAHAASSTASPRATCPPNGTTQTLPANGADYRGCNITGVTFIATGQVNSPNFSGAQFDNVRFSSVNMTDADFTSSTFTVLYIIGSQVPGIKLTGMTGSRLLAFNGSTLVGTKLNIKTQVNISFNSAVLKNVDGTGLDIQRAALDIGSAVIEDSNFSGAHVTAWIGTPKRFSNVTCPNRQVTSDFVCQPHLTALACTITGTNGDDELVGTDGDDVICGKGGDDIIDGGPGDDVIRGGPGDDVIRGGRGDDSVLGGSGNDDTRGGPGDDIDLDREDHR